MELNPISIPAQLIEYAMSKGHGKELKYLVALKMVSCRYLPWMAIRSKEFKELVGNSSNGTVRKYVKRLIDLKWVGYDRRTRMLYPRSWSFITNLTNTITIRRFPVRPRDLKKHSAFFMTAIFDKRIRSTMHFHVRRKRTIKLRPGGRITGHFAPSKDRRAILKFPEIPTPHFGLSNKTIGGMAGRSKSWGSMVKKEAVDAGYLTSTHKYVELGQYDPHKGLRGMLAEAYPDVAHQFKLQRIGTKLILLAQVHDELTSRLESSRVPRFYTRKSAQKVSDPA